MIRKSVVVLACLALFWHVAPPIDGRTLDSLAAIISKETGGTHSLRGELSQNDSSSSWRVCCQVGGVTTPTSTSTPTEVPSPTVTESPAREATVVPTETYPPTATSTPTEVPPPPPTESPTSTVLPTSTTGITDTMTSPPITRGRPTSTVTQAAPGAPKEAACPSGTMTPTTQTATATEVPATATAKLTPAASTVTPMATSTLAPMPGGSSAGIPCHPLAALFLPVSWRWPLYCSSYGDDGLSPFN